MSTENGGYPTLGELGRTLEVVRHDVRVLDQKVDDLTSIGIERRLNSIEGALSAAQTQRSSMTWQVLLIIVAAVSAGVISSLVQTALKG